MGKLRVGLLIGLNIHAQTGIGTTTPNASAKLDVFSNNKGFLPPRVSLIDIYDQTTVPSPATGLLVYCKGDAGLAAGYYYWNGNAWATIATPGGSGSFASSYLRGSRTASQSIAVGGVVTFTNVDIAAGSDISLNTSTGRITLAPGNTYRIRGVVPNYSGGQRPSFIWYNETTSSNIGSATHSYNTGDAAAYGAFGTPAELIITPSVTTVIYFKLLSSLNSGSVTVGGNGDFSITGSYPWFDIQVISGNAPITGQSVDYVSVSRTGTDQTVNTGNAVIFNTINGGNIPYNTSTGAFSLTAGKTYKLIGNVTLSNGNTAPKEVNIVWKNTDGDLLGTKGELLSPSAAVDAAGNGIAYAIYTPTVNTTVTLYVNYSTTNAILWQNFTFASIEQIGSSAIVNPWTLSGTTTYNTLGNVGIGTSTPATKLDVSGDVSITGKINLTDPSGTVATKITAYVDAGTFVNLDNIKASVTTSGSRGLSLATVSGSFTAFINGTYATYNGNMAGLGTSAAISTTATSSIFGWNFIGQGDTAIYIINDSTNKKVYRITLMIGGSYLNNLIIIERLL
ncbi:MAG: hypothetical protein RLZ95_1695 [Bacteroidota bacterium]|jgi:hypothetical protein